MNIRELIEDNYIAVKIIFIYAFLKLAVHLKVQMWRDKDGFLTRR